MNPFLGIAATRSALAIAMTVAAAAALLIYAANSCAARVSGRRLTRPVDLEQLTVDPRQPQTAARAWLATSLVIDFALLTSVALITGIASVWANTHQLPVLGPLSAPVAWLACAAALFDAAENIGLLWTALWWTHPIFIPAALTAFNRFCTSAKQLTWVGLGYSIAVGAARLRSLA